MSSETEKTKKNFRVIERQGGLIYTSSNYTNVDWTGYDLRIRFSELSAMPFYNSLDAAKDETVTHQIEERVSVAMSWSLAKALAKTLNEAISAFEEKNGEINPPKSP